MPRTCTICINPQRNAMETAHHSGAANRRIATQYGVAEASLRRHFASHVEVVAKASKKTTHEPKPPVTRVTGKRPSGIAIPLADRADIQQQFLIAFRRHGIITRACDEAGIDRSTIYKWGEQDGGEEGTFGFAFAQAKEAVNDMYRDEARRRAVNGTESYVVNQGKLVYDPETGKPLIERKYSDALLQFVMKAKMPEYREKQQMEISGKDGGPIHITQNVRGLTDEELAAMKTLLQTAVARNANTSSDRR